jgi:pimeloyl-ACP methyl ester carboxylesterase
MASQSLAAQVDEVTSRSIDVRGTQVHVSSAGMGPALLVLHAAGGAGAWLPAYSALAQAFTVVVPEHPGFGRSASLAGGDQVQDLAFHYADLLDHLELGRVSVLGASFGGWIAAELALIEPQRVSHLVLVDAIGLRIAGAPIRDLFMMDPGEMMAALFHDPAVPARLFPAAPSLDFIMQMYRDEAAFARYAWSPFCCNPKLLGRLHRIRAATLVLWGEHDALVPIEHGRRFADAIPGARLQIIADAGHAALMEAGAAVAGAVLPFLQTA